ncbi:MAG: TonB-dependent receptor [Acidobacteriota bacterium]|nr:TonB-dependent receptor [Acidobacteriota bacterium]
MAIALSVTATSAVFGQGSGQQTGNVDLTQASLEDLMSIQVTSVSKKEQSMSRVGAAAFVLNSEDIVRSGATNIPDLLRLVPGVNVAQIDSHTWAITVRGFNDLYANKVLVLIDGRSVYTPLTSGVDWDQQDVPLEDIERIEVIRGPGGTVWGANAVNGVINIITKNSAATHGGLVTAEGGTRTGRSLVQYGGGVGQVGAYRLFGSYADTTNSLLPGGLQAPDSTHTWHAGARSDWTLSPRDTLTVQGDYVRMQGGREAAGGPNVEVTASDASILGRWTRSLSNGSDLSLQASFDHYNRNTGPSEIRSSTDLDFKHHLKIGSRHDVVWGLGFHSTSGLLGGDPLISGPSPAQRETDNRYSVFAQDEIKLTENLSLTLGSKLEHNHFTGIEYAPSAQLVWRPSVRQEVWMSAARAIREPNVADSVELAGQPQHHSETLRDLEVGYRTQISRKVSLDVATFFNLYNNLSELVTSTPIVFQVPNQNPNPNLGPPAFYSAIGRARSYGGEMFATWKATSRWRIVPSYSFIHINTNWTPSANEGSGNTNATTPRHQIQIRSLFNPTRSIDWDTTLAWIAALGTDSVESVPAYVRLDMRLAKRIGEHVEISLVGQNLTSGRHLEFITDNRVAPALVSRSVFGRAVFRF